MAQALRLPARRLFATAARAHAPPPTLTAEHLFKVDSQLSNVKAKAAEYHRPAPPAAVQRAVAALQQKKHTAEVVSSRADALKALKAQIPDGASVYSTSSISLAEIGYLDWAIQAKSLPFKNLNAGVLAEKDPAKQAELRRQTFLADVVLTSPVAVTEAGELFITDASGTRVAPILGGRKLVFVVGANKIVPTLEAARKRLHEFAYPLESARLRIAYNLPPTGQSTIANEVVLHTQGILGTPKVHVILVNDALGF